ncbi:MAG: VTT domain-containing protein [Candidatus Omnitrophota bacterium]
MDSLFQLQDLIRWGGYLVLIVIVFSETGLLIGFFLPGDSLLVTAGLVAAMDHSLSVGTLILSLSAAAILGDATGYAIGYFAGPRLFKKEDSFFFRKSHVERTHKFYEKYGNKTIVIARFVPIVRTFAPTLAGVGKMGYRRFALYNIVGGIGWVSSMVLIGYYLANSIPNIEKKIHWVVLAVIFLSILPILKEIYSSRKEAKKKVA